MAAATVIGGCRQNVQHGKKFCHKNICMLRRFDCSWKVHNPNQPFEEGWNSMDIRTVGFLVGFLCLCLWFSKFEETEDDVPVVLNEAEYGPPGVLYVDKPYETILVRMDDDTYSEHLLLQQVEGIPKEGMANEIMRVMKERGYLDYPDYRRRDGTIGNWAKDQLKNPYYRRVTGDVGLLSEVDREKTNFVHLPDDWK